MKKIFLLTIAALLFLFTDTRAQSSGQVAEPRLGIGVDFGLPLGSFKDVANFGTGGSLLYQHPVSAALNITGNIGYIRFNGKETIGTLKYRQSFISIMGGARYFVTQNIYAAAEAGTSISTANGGGAALAYAPELGVEIPVSHTGSLDIGVQYKGWSKSSGTISFAGLRVGYNF